MSLSFFVAARYKFSHGGYGHNIGSGSMLTIGWERHISMLELADP